MSVYLPYPYPEEILFSVVGRYFRINDVQNPYAVTVSLFGSPYYWGRSIPVDLSHLAIETQDCWSMSASEIAFRLTVQPFTLALGSAGRGTALIRAPGNRKPIAYMREFSTTRNVFRFCGSCVDQDIAEHRYPYWRRVHQLHGVYFCPIHQKPLFEYTRARHMSEIPLPDQVRNSAVEIALDESADQRVAAVKVAQTAQYLLCCGDVGMGGGLAKLYRSWAWDMGFGSQSNISRRALVSRKALAQGIERYYGTGFIEKTGFSGVDRIVSHLGGGRSAPLRHLLLAVFLSNRAGVASRPTCPNHSASHGPNHECEIIRQSGERGWSARCSCGMCLIKPSGETNYRVSRYAREYIVRAVALRESGLSPFAISKEMNVNESTVRFWFDGRHAFREP